MRLRVGLVCVLGVACGDSPAPPVFDAAPDAQPDAPLVGEVDTSFGTNGLVRVDLDGSESAGGAVILPSGDILVVIGSSQGSRLVRFHPDGTLDPVFAPIGSVGLKGMANDGSFYLAGCPKSGLVVEHRFADLVLDTGYALGPKPSLPPGTFFENFDDCAAIGGMTSSGSLLHGAKTAGIDTGSTLPPDSTLITKILPTGQFDPDFGTGGIAKPGTGTPRAFAVQTDGKFLILVMTAPATATKVVRLDANGTTDPTFGVGGSVTFPVNGLPDGIAFTSDGASVVTSSRFDTQQAFVTRLTASGDNDFSFAGGGSYVIDGGKYQPLVRSGGDVVLFGSDASNTPSVIALDATGTRRVDYPNPAGAETMPFALWQSAQNAPDGSFVTFGTAITTANPDTATNRDFIMSRFLPPP